MRDIAGAAISMRFGVSAPNPDGICRVKYWKRVFSRGILSFLELLSMGYFIKSHMA